MRHPVVISVCVQLLSCFAALQVLCSGIAAASQLSSPRVGVVRYADGGLYVIYGLPGSYVVGPRMLDGVDEASFSSQGGLVARQGSITLLNPDFSTAGTFAAGDSKPVLNIEGDLKTAIAWLPSAQKLVHWKEQEFVSVSAPDVLREGDVTSLSKRDDRTALVLLHSANGSVSEAAVSLETGQLISVIPVGNAHGRAFRQKSFVLFEDKGELVMTNPLSGDNRRTAIAGNSFEVERASTDGLHVKSKADQRDWILHFREDGFDISELPPPAPSVSSVVPMAEVVK